ncbi:MAG: hypothetical protein ABIP06_01635, partial [Pyrinomonadaceae bacterium]
ELTVLPFFNSETFKVFYKDGSNFSKLRSVFGGLSKRFFQVFESRKYDLVFIQREAMLFGPAFFEVLFQKIGKCPIVLDLDDATYVSYVSPTYGKIGSFFKFFGKTDKLIKRSERVICGNRFIADYAEKKGAETLIVPTVVDTDKFKPLNKNNDVPVIGWIGTHSTFPLLESVFPVLQKLASEYEFVLKIVGAGRDNIQIKNVEVKNLEWNLEREIDDFQSLDIGLYPITTSTSANTEWLMGKSGFKSIQYLAIGIPFVVTPFGVSAEIGVVGETHFEAVSGDDWYNSLSVLISDENLRKKMGRKGREYAIRNFTLDIQSEKIAQMLRDVLKFK